MTDGEREAALIAALEKSLARTYPGDVFDKAARTEWFEARAAEREFLATLTGRGTK